MFDLFTFFFVLVFVLVLLFYFCFFFIFFFFFVTFSLSFDHLIHTRVHNLFGPLSVLGILMLLVSFFVLKTHVVTEENFLNGI